MDRLRDLFAYHVLQSQSRRHLHHRPQMAVFTFDDISHLINLYGQYERAELDAFFTWSKSHGIDFSNSVALDVGANIGNHSLAFAEAFREVHSFEPNPRTYKLLSMNAELALNIKTYNVGLSDKDGTSTLQINPANVAASRIAEKREGQPSVSIELRALDTLLGDLTDIKLIKIDVEGHEYPALIGARRLITSNKPFILFEQHAEDFIDGKSQVISLLEEYGYSQFAVLESPALKTKISNRYARALYVWLRSKFPGGGTSMKVTSKIRVGTHPFIVAVPRWSRIGSA